MKLFRQIIVAGFAVWLLVTSAATQAQQADASDAYRVLPGDILEISVWREEDLQRQVLVRPDSAFTFPLCGDISARDQTISNLRDEITRRLSKYISDPVVTVSVAEIQGNKIYVIGQVRDPGAFIVNPQVDVLQALSMAGGGTAFAKLNDIKILRRSAGIQRAIEFRYDDVANGKGLSQNIMLQAGDVVIVP